MASFTAHLSCTVSLLGWPIHGLFITVPVSSFLILNTGVYDIFNSCAIKQYELRLKIMQLNNYICNSDLILFGGNLNK